MTDDPRQLLIRRRGDRSRDHSPRRHFPPVMDRTLFLLRQGYEESQSCVAGTRPPAPNAGPRPADCLRCSAGTPSACTTTSPNCNAPTQRLARPSVRSPPRRGRRCARHIRLRLAGRMHPNGYRRTCLVSSRRSRTASEASDHPFTGYARSQPRQPVGDQLGRCARAGTTKPPPATAQQAISTHRDRD